MSRNLSRIVHCLCTGLFLSAVSLPVMAQADYSKIEVSTSEVLPGIYLLAAEGGGNMILSVGDDGALLIDDHLAPLTAKVQKAIAAVTDQPVRFLVNTHWHFDHAGGNEVFGSGGAIIVAHDNVRERMAKGQVIAAFNMVVPPLKEQGKSLEEIIVAKPTADYDAAWGKGMLGPDAWVGIIYSAL